MPSQQEVDVMKHQPFEKWLLEQDALQQADRLVLSQHLADCEHCRRLALAIQDVDRKLMSAGMQAPAPGFTGRWRSRLAEHRRRTHQVQTTAIVLALIAGLSALGVLVTYQFVNGLQLSGSDFIRWLDSVAAAISQIKLVFGIWKATLGGIMARVPWVYRIGWPVTLAVLSVLWFSSMYRLGYLPIRRRF